MKPLAIRLQHVLLSVLMLASFALAFLPTNAAAQPSQAAGHCNNYFLLTIPAWYNNVNKPSDGGGCEIISPTEVGGIGPFIWIIVLNIVELILVMAGYAAVAFIIYGGYKYMISAGSPEGMVAARKTITNAAIGLIISVAAVAIIRTVSGGLGIN